MANLPETIRDKFLDVIVGLVVSAIVGIIGKAQEKWSWPTTIVYGFIVTTCVIFIFDRITAPISELPKAEVANEQNIESKVPQWLGEFGYRNQKFITPPSGCYFAYDVVFPDETGLSICHSTAHNGKYLLLSTRINLSDNDAAWMDKQDQSTLAYFGNVLGIEAGRAKLDMDSRPPYHTILLTHLMPIEEITEYDFITALRDQQMTCHLMLSLVNNTVADLRRMQASSTPH